MGGMCNAFAISGGDNDVSMSARGKERAKIEQGIVRIVEEDEPWLRVPNERLEYKLPRGILWCSGFCAVVRD